MFGWCSITASAIYDACSNRQSYAASRIGPWDTYEALVVELNAYFHAFADIIEKYLLEKIKTTGVAISALSGPMRSLSPL